jgi:hypothetical protein
MARAVSNVYQAVLCGNRKLAGYLVEEGLKDSFTGFGYLHKDVRFFYMGEKVAHLKIINYGLSMKCCRDQKESWGP